MTIAVEPTKFRVPGKGEVTVNQLEVRVASYTLGVSATAYYDLQNKSVVEKSREVQNPNYNPGTIDENGNVTPPEPKLDLDGNPVDQSVQFFTETYTEEVTTSFGLNGNDSLTEEQFANWGNDDTYFAKCIAENLGLVPVI